MPYYYYMKKRACSNCGIIKNLEEDYYQCNKSTCKDCIKNKAKEWNKQNKERAKAHQRRYYQKHKERLKEYSLARYKLKYWTDDLFREYVKEKSKKWRREHPIEKRENTYAWRKKNAYKWRKICQNYRTRKKGIFEVWSIDEWLEKINKTEGFCPKCGKHVGIEKLTLDHIYPLSKAEEGRIYTIDDIQPLCLSCNSSKGAAVNH